MNFLYVLALSVFCLLYAWAVYNVPILAVGVKRLRRSGSGDSELSVEVGSLPFFSVVVPVKDEEKVIDRLVGSLLRVDYPHDKLEIVLVEDGSVDETCGICASYVERFPGVVRLLRRSVSDGKPSALNYALKQVRGEIVGVFDADSVPSSDIFSKAAEYFAGSSVAAVQGQVCSINGQESMLSRFISYEESVRYGTYLNGKDVLSLFVPLTGSCYFVRKSVLDAVGGWDGGSLSEDTELSARLVEAGHRIRYAADVRSWQENPSGLGQLFGQRLRWFRGCMEVSLRYGRLLVKNPGLRSVDAEMTLFGPFLLPLSLVSYVMALYALFSGVWLDPFSMVFTYGVSVLSVVSLLVIGLSMVCVVRPRKLSNLLWLPFVYLYWGLQILLSLFALFQILLRRPRKWLRTAKTGMVSNSVFDSLR